MKKFILTNLLILLFFSVTVQAQELPETTLSAVKEIYTCSLSKTKVKLSWDAVEGADSYLLFRKNANSTKYQQLAELTKCSYTDKTIKYNKSYTYRIVPVTALVPLPDTEETTTTTDSLENTESSELPDTPEVSILPETTTESETLTTTETPTTEAPATPEPSPVPEQTVTYVYGPETTKTFSNQKIVASDHQKYSYTEMKKDISQLTDKYHGLVSAEEIGESTDGRILYDVILGNPDAEKTILVVSALHAREYMTSLLSMSQIEYYLEQYNNKIDGTKVADVLEEICIHYIPMANPDGVTISQYGISKIESASLQKKLKKLTKNSTATWKANARGVDLNRNFPYDFKVRGKVGSAGYSGASANSEKETAALTALIKTLKKETALQGVINYHAMGSIIFGNYDTTIKKSVAKDIDKMYRLAKDLTGYSSAAGYYKGNSSGSNGNLREYLMYNLKIPSITIEIGRKACPLPISEFSSIWLKNKNLVIREAALFL